MPPVTAETITDEQILELRDSMSNAEKNVDLWRYTLDRAIDPDAGIAYWKARARCAEAINARAKVTP